MNNKTIQYKINEKHFKYHLRKGIFLAGSRISNSKHKNEYIEQWKNKLIKGKKVIKKSNHYFLKDNVNIGYQFACCLHFDDEIDQSAKAIEILKKTKI